MIGFLINDLKVILFFYFSSMAQHNELGKKGEQLAVDYLLEKNYEIIERNYRFDKAEVDVIAKKDDILAIVEVKTRSTIDFGNPQDFVKPKQIKNLVKAVDEYVTENDLDIEVRFDIIAIVKKGKGFEIEHLENAFYHF
ncbi:hypothetical protein FBALC1_00942 [Flavobacteriales bacterium ALC-1]|nr:hypothetical protein FBALC1_00942 [Flavobacteriales bacterium ALC-1]